MPWDKSNYNKELRSDAAISMKQAVKNLFREYNLEGKVEESKLIQSWGEIMGATVASRTSKVYIKDKVLFVHITSAPLRQELAMSKEKVMDLLF